MVPRVKVVQHPTELREFLDLVRAEGIRSFLEIGSKWGGLLRDVGMAMPAGSRVVSIDLPEGTKAWPETRITLPRVIEDLKAAGRDAHLIWGDSTDPTVVEAARALGTYDLIFIDANHTWSYVCEDWKNYSPMGRRVGFHDIGWHRPAGYAGSMIDVPRLWEKLKPAYRHVEIRHDVQDNGIGVLWTA